MTRAERLREIAKAGLRLEAEHGYPPRLLLAQWALESAWGERETGEFNYFGITFNPVRHQSFRMCPTHEEMSEMQILSLPDDERATISSKTLIRHGVFRIALKRKFASYKSLDEALRDKISLIMRTERYSGAFAWYRIEKNLDKLIASIAAAGYATAGNYGNTLMKISRQENIARAIEEAREECLTDA
jgi:flagellum-specific peptidoglycan hydrolase FlgJ